MIKLKANFLNEHCHCSTLDTQKLPAFFSAAPHFLAKADLARIQEFIGEYETMLANPAVRENFLQNLPSEFSKGAPEKGVFNSYDFHISANGPQLIEINSNAGGALLSLLAAENIRHCCVGMHMYLPEPGKRFDRNRVVQMFREEFRLQFPDRTLRSVAIVDEAPESQYFYQEFLLTKELLEAAGFTVQIVAPEDLRIVDGIAYAHGQPIDFIYNRLTDFYFERENSRVLREIYREGLAAVSPSPAVHALYARKSNLVSAWDDDFAARAGIAPEKLKKIRGHIPETNFVTQQNSARLWQDRRGWFFKPVSGFGGKGAYRGDKITKKVWDHITTGDYIAQRYVAPELRRVSETDTFKYDIRVYTYAGQLLGIAARYYQGQTTNFRTAGGGLATVLIAA